MNNTEATSLRSAHETPETAYKQFELDDKYFKTICTGSFDLDDANNSRQSFPETYTPNGYVDIFKASFALNSSQFFGEKMVEQGGSGTS